MNTEMAYLLGMVTGNGTIQRGSTETTVSIEIPHKKMKTDFDQDVAIYVKASITDIRNILEPMFGSSLAFSTAKKYSTLSFTRQNKEYLMREIIRFMDRRVSHETMRIPEAVYGFTMDERRAFAKGFGDVTAYIRKSNAFWGHPGENRVYVEIPHNWHLVIDYCKLLQSLGIAVQSIDWAHPNMRDPQRKEEKAGKLNSWKKEHQVKVWAALYESIGFTVIHKSQALAIYAKEQRDILDAKGKDINSINVYYWDKQERIKKKAKHPAEDDSFIVADIRGKHYDAWHQIANDLGYNQGNTL